MPESLNTTIAQFSSAGGRWQPRAINVRAVEPAADLPSAQRGSLFMLLEVIGGGPAPLHRQLLSAAQAAFYEKGENVETALKLAVRSVHLALHQANESQPGARWRAGISLVSRYADQLTIAQAGPGLVLVSHPKTVDQFPAEFGDWGAPLGGDEAITVQVYDAVVEPNSMLLLAQSDWLHNVAPQALAVASAAPDLSLANQYLGQLAGQADLSALLVRFNSVIPEVVEPRSHTPSWPVETPAEPERGKGLLSSVGKLFGGRAGDEPAPAAPALHAAGSSPASVEPPAPRPVVIPTAAPVTPASFEPIDDEMWDEAEAIPPSPATAEPERERKRGGLGGKFWLLLAVIGIPLLIALLVLAMIFGRARVAQQQFTQLLDGATTAITEAEGLTDEAQIRQRLSGAKDFLDKARTSRPDDAQLAQLTSRYQAVLDKVDKVTPLYGILPLYSFQQVGHSAASTLVNGDSLFVLDRGRGEVNRFALSPLGDSVTFDKAVVRKGDQLDNQAVGDLLDMTWAEAAGPNQRSKLVALDASRGLVGYDSTWGTVRLPLGGSSKLVRPQRLASYSGNLYVADPGASQIWRFRPGANGYEDEPEAYFVEGKPVDLTGMQAMAIDGNIWLLYADGRLLKFFQGEQRSFEIQGVPGGLSAPTALAVPLEGDLLYILDAGNGRIVEVTKEGAFTRQFRPRESAFLRSARSMYLNEALGKLYLVTPDQLYVADVPAPAADTTAQPAAAP